MKGLFCGGCKARNNEEYRLVLHKRQKRMWLLLGVGILTAAVGMLGRFLLGVEGSRQIAMVVGFGVGLALGACIAVHRIHRILTREEKLKEQRLKETDERELEVGNQALQATAKLILALLYILMIVGGLFVEEVMWVCWLLIGAFLISYWLFHKYYEKKL